MREPTDQHDLCPKSKAAIDALIESGFDASRVDPAHADRAAGVARALGALNAGAVDADAHATATKCLAKIRRHEAEIATPVTLNEHDGEALDVLANSGWDTKKVPHALRASAERQSRLLSSLDAASLDGREARIGATLARVRAHADSQADRMRFTAAPSGRSWRLRDVAAVAAMLLVGAMLIWPALSNVRQNQAQSACIGNLKALGGAVTHYGNDFRNSLPLASASMAGGTWWNIGTPEQSNSANYFTLRRAGYAPLRTLSCAGLGCDELPADARDWQKPTQVTLSFQNLFATQRTTLDAPGTWVVSADRSPVVVRAMRGERVVFYDENSFNHGGRGQNVLCNDGSGRWMTTPILVSGDNLWLPRSIENMIDRANRMKSCAPLRGIEEPMTRDDSFVCP